MLQIQVCSSRNMMPSPEHGAVSTIARKQQVPPVPIPQLHIYHNQKCKELPQIQFLSCLTSDVILWSGLSTVCSRTFNLNTKIKRYFWNYGTSFILFLTILINRCVGTSVADPVLFNPWIQDPDPGWKTNPESGSGMNITDLIFKNIVQFFVLKILKLFGVRIQD